MTLGIAWLLAGACWAADTPAISAPALCSNSGGAPACHAPANDLKEARKAFAHAVVCHHHGGPLDSGFMPECVYARRKSMTRKPKKKKIGRPATGKTPMIGLRLELEARREVEAWAKRRGLTFSAAVRQLIAMGLAK